MRLRNKPWAEPFLEENDDLVLKYSDELKDNYHNIFDNNESLNLEIGTGKGDFIKQLASLNLDKNYIGIEKYSTVLAIAAKKIKNETELTNVKLMCYDASELEKIFNLESLDCIYLNFSDPWPKARHAKRRLTYKTFLDKYYSLLKKGGKIIMKTDNLGLFEYSLESIKEHNKFKLVEYTFDYEFDGSCDGMSEYERKFREIGTKINRLVCIKE